ncbi:MAG TPA: septum formation initiator family protein [Actinomycetota bacterium]|nr:septum formation initiator family protein [Actinomycetota bacterium]
MPPAPGARASRRAPKPRRAARGRPRLLAGGAAAIRWDRVSRVALLAVLLGLVLLYAGPARSYWDTMQQAKQRRAEVAELKRENERLRERRRALRSAGALEREARRLGMTRPGERPYVVENLPKGP